MQRLGSQYVRIMSYAVREGRINWRRTLPSIAREITKRFLDAGITPVHENCMNYGGMSWQRAEIAGKCSWSQMGL